MHVPLQVIIRWLGSSFGAVEPGGGSMGYWAVRKVAPVGSIGFCTRVLKRAMLYFVIMWCLSWLSKKRRLTSVGSAVKLNCADTCGGAVAGARLERLVVTPGVVPGDVTASTAAVMA